MFSIGGGLGGLVLVSLVFGGIFWVDTVADRRRRKREKARGYVPLTVGMFDRRGES